MWHRRYQEVWFEGDDPAIDLQGRKRLSKDTRELVGQAIESLHEMRNDIEHSLDILNTVRKAKKKSARQR
jgi:hypothetical protein